MVVLTDFDETCISIILYIVKNHNFRKGYYAKQITLLLLEINNPNIFNTESRGIVCLPRQYVSLPLLHTTIYVSRIEANNFS